MRTLLGSESTIAIILGASDWTRAGLNKAKSFHKSAAFVNKYLLQSRPYGLAINPGLVLNLFDDTAPPSEQLTRVRDFVREIVIERRGTQDPIEDVLIYYIGHGTCDDGNTLHLLVRDTREGIETQSSISTPDLAKVLKVAAPQQRRICIFDCCFSEGAVDAFGAMGGLDEAVTKIGAANLVADPPSPQRGTMLLCSSPRGTSSIGLPNAERTLFTGALLQVLQSGSRVCNSMLSFSDVKDAVYEIMLLQHAGIIVPRPALHQPHQHDGDLTRLPAFPNVQVLREQEAVPLAREDERQKYELPQRQIERSQEEQQPLEIKNRKYIEKLRRGLKVSIERSSFLLAFLVSRFVFVLLLVLVLSTTLLFAVLRSDSKDDVFLPPELKNLNDHINEYFESSREKFAREWHESFEQHANPSAEVSTTNQSIETNRSDVPDAQEQEEPDFSVFKIVTLASISFGYDKSNITKEGAEELQGVLNWMARNKDSIIIVEGYSAREQNADGVWSSDEYEKAMSERRAKAVKSWLVNSGASPSKIETVGYGVSKVPVKGDGSVASRRRVEIREK